VRLSSANAPAEIERFQYDRDAQAVGIVHFGIGAFHRAHQAWYTDRAMDVGDRDWMIAGVSLRSPAVAEAMNPQDGLYTVIERSAGSNSFRLVGAVREVLVAARERQAIVDRLAAARTHVASFTVTEKGYCRATDGSLDVAAAGEGFYPLLTEALAIRRQAGIGGLTLLSCDNLSENGAQLARLMREYLAAQSPDLVDWFDTECTCPATMVDRIVPATADADRAGIESEFGLRDEAAVSTEPFSQWVIEDRFAGPRPRWERVGVQLVGDVVPYETAKLRMLNGAHSALAYLGLARGHEFVHQAIADPILRPLIDGLMRREAAPSFVPAPGQDLDAYADALLVRFANPALNHRLAQIAMDGSEKLPQRWLATLAAQRRRGRRCPAILAGLAAWLRYVRGDGHAVSDPRAAQLQAAWNGRDPAAAAHRILVDRAMLGNVWTPDETDLRTLGENAAI